MTRFPGQLWLRSSTAAFALLLVSAGAASGCRYQNLNATGPDGHPSPWVNLECNEPGNDIGFSFEVPRCVCENGIRVRYVGKKQADGSYQIYYEQERGYISGEPRDLIVMRSTSPDRPEVLFVGGRRLPPPDRASPAEQEAWRLSTENWASILKLYGPGVMRNAFRTCEEDREAKAAPTRVARAE
ncbi:MAG: hypothetical protein HY906_19430 [Deltaproteobacteria bacterium]|nr:hypothetical protein [Deltaproteobacteria bacterium]